MSTDVTMPALGESVTEGTVTTWLKNVGDTVALDEPLVEVSTDKVDSEVPSPAAGVLLEILAHEDDTVEVGTVIARIGDASEAAVPTPAVQAPAPVTAPAPAPASAIPAPSPAATPSSGVEVTMPALGESVSEGTVTTWLKAVGDRVEADEPLLEVSTDKVDSEVPAPISGWLAQILVEEDETVEVGTVVAVISEAEPTAQTPVPVQAATPAPVAAPAPTPMPSAPVAPAAPAPAPTLLDTALPQGFGAPLAPASAPAAPAPAVPASMSGGYVTPIVRKLAREAGIDLSTVTGTGVGGRIRREDIEAAVAASATSASQVTATSAPVAAAPAFTETRTPSPLRGTTEKMSRLRQTISRRMVESLQTAAQLTTVIEVDVTKIAHLRARAKNDFLARENTKLTFLPFFVKAATESLLYHPKINATIRDKEVTYFDHEHVGIACDTERGLLVPVIKNAGEKSLADIARSINDLAARTRNATASADELSGSTFTITNTGSGGALFDTPVLNMPETAIMGVGTIVKRPVVVKDALGADSIAIRSMVYVSLSYDHRLVDGADASRFLMDVKKRLEEGAFEAELGL
ncbi:2-oxoglutarate dehydrogenase, E2 component, dihydrolipoamide succinyltransferase [Schaalia sp. lx-100]|uniref:2-oxoglutarate dehydrogenase, E2 component, dihydrolipoamide succinyltransferase n=1 Tax=Schaalia sp. lx-100 TaxID=2899081 RepID=UPI001E2DC6AB|nr:2-oxoglutarate dehydrogenase, E2 component, dihydrolipoamide succinyltransferase [Schaalia sp. lx-100]MCD4556940.1 2-oxoglutarate dehydrogenase, E2 component, dihydrolipoamide succinyltransferase [Schaalia sp. lx-100]